MISRLIKLANKLDKNGLYDVAGKLDRIIIRLAMTYDEALNMIGVSNSSSPSEMKKAYISLAVENHPDKGGDEEKMKNINHAYDILAGKARPDRPASSDYGWARPTQSERPPPPPREYVTWSQAASSAGVPLGMDCIFVTQAAETSEGFTAEASSAFVVYGKNGNGHVLVGVHHYRNMDYTTSDVSKYTMWVKEFDESFNLRQAPSLIRSMWEPMQEIEPKVRGYNAKVVLLNVPFEESLLFENARHGRAVSFKNAMAIMDERVPEEWSPGPTNVLLEVGEGSRYGSVSHYAGRDENKLTLVVSGKAYELGKSTLYNIYYSPEGVERGFSIMDNVFPEGEWAKGDKKYINQIQKGKSILERIINALVNEPEELRDGLEAALGEHSDYNPRHPEIWNDAG